MQGISGLRKNLGNGCEIKMNQYIVYGVCLFCAMLGASGQLFLKIGAKPFNIFIIGLALGLYGIAMVLFTIMLRFDDLHILYSIIATSYIFVTIFSSTILKETVTKSQWLGVFIIIIGVVIVTFK